MSTPSAMARPFRCAPSTTGGRLSNGLGPKPRRQTDPLACTLSQAGQEATFHIDHVQPIAAGGPTAEDNLALACISCSLRKAAHQFAPDPETGLDAPSYNPRRQVWNEHFRWDGVRV